ncbi:hypothetical protein C8R46DRAFT_1357237 [Mycena filopes]|nr:hypothetical protein C8R46DRAFT_1357237 [Mycena filopes]
MPSMFTGLKNQARNLLPGAKSTTPAPNDAVYDLLPPPAYPSSEALPVDLKSPAEPASDRAEKPTIESEVPSVKAKLAKAECLKKYDTIVIIDDSSSMYGSRWRNVRRLIGQLAPMITAHDKDGIDVMFMNRQVTNTNCKNTLDVSKLFEDVVPDGTTPIGSVLWRHLQLYLTSEKKLKPRNYLILTDGEPFPSQEYSLLRNTLLDTASTLRKLNRSTFECGACHDAHRQVGVQLVQIGNESAATKFLNELDRLCGAAEDGEWLEDFVDTQPYLEREITESGLMDVICGGIMADHDAKGEHERGLPRPNAQKNPFAAITLGVETPLSRKLRA